MARRRLFRRSRSRHSSAAHRGRRDLSAFQALIDSPHDFGAISAEGAENTLSIPAQARLAISCSDAILLGQVNVTAGEQRTFSTPDLEADELFKGCVAEADQVIDISSDGATGTLSLFIIDWAGDEHLIGTGTIGPSATMLEDFDDFDLDTMTGMLPDVVWETYEYPSGPEGEMPPELVITKVDGAIRLQYEVIDTPHSGGYFSFDTGAGSPIDFSEYSELWVDITVNAIAPGDRIWFFDYFAGESGKGDGAPGHKVGTPVGETGSFTLKFTIAPGNVGAPSANSGVYIENDEGYLNDTGDLYDITIDNIRGIPIA